MDNFFISLKQYIIELREIYNILKKNKDNNDIFENTLKKFGNKIINFNKNINNIENNLKRIKTSFPKIHLKKMIEFTKSLPVEHERLTEAFEKGDTKKIMETLIAIDTTLGSLEYSLKTIKISEQMRKAA